MIEGMTDRSTPPVSVVQADAAGARTSAATIAANVRIHLTMPAESDTRNSEPER
jgi:hypothetical protein